LAILTHSGEAKGATNQRLAIDEKVRRHRPASGRTNPTSNRPRLVGSGTSEADPAPLPIVSPKWARGSTSTCNGSEINSERRPPKRSRRPQPLPTSPRLRRYEVGSNPTSQQSQNQCAHLDGHYPKLFDEVSGWTLFLTH